MLKTNKEIERKSLECHPHDRDVFTKTYKIGEMLKYNGTKLFWTETEEDDDVKDDVKDEIKTEGKEEIKKAVKKPTTREIIVSDYEHAFTRHHMSSGLWLKDKLTNESFYFFVNCWNGFKEWSMGIRYSRGPYKQSGYSIVLSHKEIKGLISQYDELQQIWHLIE